MFAHRQTGFTLVELMVAMAIGTVIILGAGQLFLTTFQTFRQVDELSRKQETIVFAASSIVRRIRGSENGESEYRLACRFENAECLCSIYDESGDGNPEPVLSFKKELEEASDDTTVSEQQCVESNKNDIGQEQPEEFLYEISLPVENDGEPIKFNVASRRKVLEQYFNGDGDGDGDGDGKTPDLNNEGFYIDGTRMYNDDCYAGNSDNFKPKFKGCDAP
jgi:prepilin-type N-terminal cleavage/methylation domain-containing protein